MIEVHGTFSAARIMNHTRNIKRFYRGTKRFSEQVRRNHVFPVSCFFSPGEKSWLEEKTQAGGSGGVKRRLACRHDQSSGTRETG